MALSSKSLAGPGYIILNAIRAMNIIAFLAVIAASVVMLVKTSTASKFFFFDAVSHVVTAVTSMFLLTSELSLFREYFARNWPLLSPSHGFVALASIMIILGVNILGNLNKAATSQESLGLAMWRVVIASGILVFILGFFNLFASFIFRDSSQGITARQVRAKGAVALNDSTPISSSHITAAPSMQTISRATSTKSSTSPLQGFTKSEEASTLPSYYSNTPDSPKPNSIYRQAPISPTSKYSRATCDSSKKIWTNSRFFGGRKRDSFGPALPIKISAPMNVNPQFAHLVQRPDSAMHPSRTAESETLRWGS